MIYVHIPFCKSHCTYCAFYSELLRQMQGSDAFIDAICKEISRCETKISEPATLYLGGGTPSLLSADQIARIHKQALKLDGSTSFEEFTVEVNPDDVISKGLRYAQALREIGVNRISMGVQSFDDAVLKKMGRRHNAQEAFNAFHILREAGFENISIDLIFGFTSDFDLEGLRNSLMQFDGLPEHISCYQLSLEQGSGLSKMIDKGLWSLPSDEECALQYALLCEMLGEFGYEHYEVSNWARPGRKSLHNKSYWKHIPYQGFGPGAHSLDIKDGICCRHWNEADLSLYLQAARSGRMDEVRDSEVLDSDQVMEERIMLGLRTGEGLHVSELEHRQEMLEKMIKDGRLETFDSGRIGIPENKWFISDSIILELI